MLEFESFHKKFKKETVLQMDQWKLEDGIYWLKGENGAGKSTFLKSLSGIFPFEGDVKLDGTSLRKNKLEQRRWFNYGEAEPTYPNFLTGQELLSFVEDVKEGTNELAFYLTTAFQMQSALNEKVGTYSSGMKKKLSLILTFCGSPKWILLDEPLITLDVASVQVLLQVIEQMFLNGTSFIMTSHQPLTLETVQTQTIEIKNKKLELI